MVDKKINNPEWSFSMNKTYLITTLLLTFLIASITASASRVVSVEYGTITGINQQQKNTSGGKTGGAIIGGIAGLLTGKGKSSSNKALRGIGGAAIGGAAGKTMAKGTELVYTVSLIAGGTVRVIMDSGNFHRDDCVAVEQGGASANLRRVSNEFCTNNASIPKQFKSEHKKEADECAAVKQELLAAKTVEQVKTAQMKMNILCQD